MSTSTQVEQLRTRATHLRFISGRIGATRAVAVYRLAGPDAWIGPTAQACQDALLALRRQLQANQQSLTDAARVLERLAEALEQQPPVIGLVS